MLKRVLLGTAAFAVALGLMATAASAHQCTVASRSDKGDAAAASNSQAWATFREGAEMFLGGELGLCQAGVDHVLDGLEAEGFDVDVVVNQKVTLAWGAAENSPNAEQLFADGKGIDYIDWEFVEETATPLIGEAFGICAG